MNAPAMLDLLRSYATDTGQLLLVFAGFALIERLRPAERGQPLRAAVFNVENLLIYQLINLLFVPVLIALVVGKLRKAFPGAFDLIRIDGYLDGAWKTLAFLFAYDFFYYWFHRLQHEWGFLWAQHKFHHSEESLNATTTNRHHPLEDLLRVFFIVLPMSMAFDLKPAGAGLASFIIGLWPVFIHANLRVSLGPLSPLISGPQVHRIHHSREARHLDRNYAAFFPVWDVLFGTFYRPGRDEFPATGLASGEKVTTVAQALWLPFGVWFGKGAGAPAPVFDNAAGAAGTMAPPKSRAVLLFWGGMLVLVLAVFGLVARADLP